MAKMQKCVCVGIAGLGRSGWGIHGRLIESLKAKYKIAAVFDKEHKRRAEAEVRFGCKSYSSYPQFLKDPQVELVVVAMPNHLHAGYSIQALKAHKHVVCEKPMATSLKDADRMIATAKKAKRVLSIFQNKRYDPDFQAVKRVIGSGCLGRIVMIRMAMQGFGRRWDWQTLKRFGGGTLNNTGPHLMDQALVLFGNEKPKIYSELKRTLTLGDTEDHVKVILTGKKAPTIEVEITAACPYSQNKWLVMGTQGGLTGNAKEIHWKYIDPKQLPRRKVDTAPTPDRSYNRETYHWNEKTWSKDKDKTPGQVGFYLDVYKTLRQRKQLVITPEIVRKQMWVIEQCHKMGKV